MLANAEMEIATSGCLGFEVTGALEREQRFGGWRKVRRAAQEPGDVLGEHVQHLTRGVATGDALEVRREARQVAVPRRRQLAELHLLNLASECGKLHAVGAELPLPPLARLLTTPADAGIEPLTHAVGHKELGILGPAVGALDQSYLILAQRLAVGGGSVDLMRRAVADVAIQNDQRWPALRLPESRERRLDLVKVIGIANNQHVPSIAAEALGNILAESDARLALNSDVVVVVDPAQVIETEMTCQRGGFRADALHQAAIAADGVDVI